MSIRRHSQKRETLIVEIHFGSVRIKIAHLPLSGYKAAPEYEDCRKLAAQSGTTIQEICLAAEAAANLDR